MIDGNNSSHQENKNKYRNSHNNKWKHLSFALIGLLAAGSAVNFTPQASAHINNQTQHLLEHIYNFVDGIEAKTNNLPADPASNTAVNTRATQTSVNSVQATATAIKTSVEELGKTTGLQVVTQDILNEDDHAYLITSDRDSILTVCAAETNSNTNASGLEMGVRKVLNPNTDQETTTILYLTSLIEPTSTESSCSTFGLEAGEWIRVDINKFNNASIFGRITVQTSPDATASIEKQPFPTS